MGKKVFSLCMALALCLSLLPVTALAAETNTVYVGGVALAGSSENIVYATTNGNGEVVTEGASADKYNIKWDGSTLTLRDATIQQAVEYSEKANEKIAVYLASGNMNLVLVGKNTVDALGEGSAASCGINLGGGSLTISGEEGASLSVFGGDTTNTTNSNSCGIYATGAITIDSGTVTVTGESATGSSYGICAGGAVTIEDGTVTATSGEAKGDSFGIFSESDNKLNNMTINGGTVTATAGDAVGSGWYSCGIRSNGFITINNGTVIATGGKSTGTGEQRFSMGLYAYHAITINGGTVTGKSGETETSRNYSDGIAAFGSITITGGTVTGEGNKSNNTSGIHAMQGSLTISGGIVKGIGGPGGSQSYGVRGGTIQIEAGTVTGTGGDSGNSSLGIFASNALSISGGDVTGIGSTGQLSSGIATNSKLEIKNATVKAEGGAASTQFSCGLYAARTCSIEDSTVTATGGSADTGGSYGILSDSDASTVTINGNSVVRANMTGTEGVDGKPISGDTTTQENSIVFENGVGTVYGDVTLQEDLTVAADETLTIPQDATLTIPTDVTLTNNGRIHNNGNLQVKGEITGNAVTGSGTIQGSGQWPGKPEPVPIPPTYAVTTPETPGGTVTVSPSRASSGRTVTITATPDLGFALESLTVLDSRGEEIALTDKGDGKYTFTMPASRVTVEASFAPAPLPFEDVAPGAWYEEAVRYAYFHNIMEGMRETEFAPATALTRAMAVQILYNLEGQPGLSDENLGYPYEDVDAQAWYGNAVYWARITGVATGYGDGTFQPGDSITRQEFAQMLYNYAKYKGYDLSAEGDLSQFPDSESVADWAEAAMRWANGNQLINGHDDGTIDAAGIGTRAQAASILMQFDQNLVEN